MKKRVRTLSELEKELDELVSLEVRLSRADYAGMVGCYTCSVRQHYKDMDAGHFQRRGILILRFERDNLRPQCRDCNRYFNGRPDVFEEELRDELGDRRVDELMASRHDEAHYDTNWYESEIIHTKAVVNGLLSRYV